MQTLDRSVLSQKQLGQISWQENLLEERYTHVLVSGTEGDFTILETIVCDVLAKYITDTDLSLVRL